MSGNFHNTARGDGDSVAADGLVKVIQGRLQGLAVARPALLELLKNIEPVLGTATILKNSRSTTAGVTTLSDGSEVFIKRYNFRGIIHSLKYSVRTVRPLKVLKLTTKLTDLNIPVPRALAALCEKRIGIPIRSYLVTEYIGNTLPWQKYVLKLGNDIDFLTGFTAAVVPLLAVLHDHGIRHGDLKISNIFCRPYDGNSYLFGFYDLDGATIQAQPLRQSPRIAELARLISSIALSSGNTAPNFLPALSEKIVTAYERNSAQLLERGTLARKIAAFIARNNRKKRP